jgi:hypothetical protein
MWVKGIEKLSALRQVRSTAFIRRDYGETEMSVASNYALRLPASLKRELEKVAREDGTSLNQLIVTAVAEKRSSLRTADFSEERKARADVGAALEVMNRKRGETPRDGDEI